MTDKERAYDQLRTAVEQHGGSMVFLRAGYLHGAWEIRLDGKRAVCEWDDYGFPELDNLYAPKVPDPQHWWDYTKTLIPGAFERLVRMLR